MLQSARLLTSRTRPAADFLELACATFFFKIAIQAVSSNCGVPGSERKN
jgi:hypothetical protein